MGRRLYPHKKVRYWHSYDVESVCSLFKDIGLHPQTVRKWIKAGLKTIDNKKPALIYGNDLIDFLKQQNSQNKRQTDFNQMYCMKCQDARPVFQNRVSIEQKQGFLKLSGCCRECKTRMYKSYKIDDLSQIRRTFVLGDVSELYDCAVSPCKAHIHAQDNSLENEPSEWRLF